MPALTYDHEDAWLAIESTGASVLAAAERAWRFHREPLEIRSTSINGHIVISSVTARLSKRVEFVVEEDDPDIWQALTSLEASEEWRLRALVPLRLLGVAHDRLCERGFELQGWWLSHGRITFGNTEMA